MQYHEIDEWRFIAGSWPFDPARPTPVFVHGAGQSGLFWEDQVNGLSDRFNVVALELPGHGDTPGPHIKTIEDMACTLTDFLGRLSPPDPVPIGLSMGGAIVQQALIDNPTLFRAAVLVNTGAKLTVLPTILDMIRSDFDQYLEMSRPFLASKKTDPKLLAPTFEDGARQDPEVVYADMAACNVFDVREQLGAIDAKVLVITAQDDIMTPPKYGRFLADGIPDAECVQIADAGHLSPVEKPGEVNRAIADFVEEVVLSQDRDPPL